MVCVCVGGCPSVLNINGKYSSLQLSENTADQRVKNNIKNNYIFVLCIIMVFF